MTQPSSARGQVAVPCLVYGLRLVGTDEVRYVGQTTRSLAWRFRGHCGAARRGSRLPVHCWMRHHGVEQVEAVVLVARAVEHQSEMRIIKRLRKAGARLLNATEGGDGVRGKRSRPLSAEHRAKISAVHRGHQRPMTGQVALAKARGTDLTEDLVRRARQLYDDGASVALVARQLGIRYRSAYNACTRARWRHVV